MDATTAANCERAQHAMARGTAGAQDYYALVTAGAVEHAEIRARGSRKPRQKGDRPRTGDQGFTVFLTEGTEQLD